MDRALAFGGVRPLVSPTPRLARRSGTEPRLRLAPSKLVTGRPPFLGDDAVPVISQHLNTAPVAPAWHNADCPPGLEALTELRTARQARRPRASSGA